MDWSFVDRAIGDLLAVGTAGFVAGVIVPLAFRVIGYVVDSVRVVMKEGVKHD